MKTLLMGLILSTSIFAKATSVDMTKVLATVSGYEEGISLVALLEDGRLQVVNNKGVVTTTQVSKVVLNRLSGKIMQLANVELVEKNRTMLCKMVTIPALSDLSIAQYDFDANDYSRNVTLILTRQSCTLTQEIYPKNEYSYAEATELRAQLVILALNTLAK